MNILIVSIANQPVMTSHFGLLTLGGPVERDDQSRRHPSWYL